MTQIDNQIGKVEHSRYAISAKFIPNDATTPEEEIDLGYAASSILMYKNYDASWFPYYRLEAFVSQRDALTIQKKWNASKVFISLTRYKVDKTTEGGPTTEVEDTVYLENGEFLIMRMDDPSINVIEGEENDLAQSRETTPVLLELAAAIPIVMNRKINNGAYHDITISNMIATLISQNIPDKPYKILMSTSDNAKEYESILVPPQSLVPSIRELDKVYGMYSGKLTVFFDVDIGYVLSSTKLTVKDDKAPTLVEVQHLSQSEAAPSNSGTGGSIFNKDTLSFILRNYTPVVPNTAGPAKKEVDGEHVKLVSMSVEERVGSMCKMLSIGDENGNSSEPKKETVAWQSYDNPLTIEKLRVARREGYSKMNLDFTDCDLEAFRPNLQWMTTTNVSGKEGFEGAWRLSSMSATLSKRPSTNETASVTVHCELVASTSTIAKS